MSNPVEYKRLQNEIDSAFPPGEGDPFDTTKLAEMAFLNAVMYVCPASPPLKFANLPIATKHCACNRPPRHLCSVRQKKEVEESGLVNSQYFLPFS